MYVEYFGVYGWSAFGRQVCYLFTNEVNNEPVTYVCLSVWSMVIRWPVTEKYITDVIGQSNINDCSQLSRWTSPPWPSVH